MRMADDTRSSNGMHSDAPDKDGSKTTANGTGVTLKFEGVSKRKRPVEFASERYEARLSVLARNWLKRMPEKKSLAYITTSSALFCELPQALESLLRVSLSVKSTFLLLKPLAAQRKACGFRGRCDSDKADTGCQKDYPQDREHLQCREILHIRNGRGEPQDLLATPHLSLRS